MTKTARTKMEALLDMVEGKSLLMQSVNLVCREQLWCRPKTARKAILLIQVLLMSLLSWNEEKLVRAG